MTHSMRPPMYLAALGLMAWTSAWAAPAATLLFTQPGSQIVDSNGATRPAQRGDVLQVGERVLTPEGTITQLVLSDGSIIGMRPGSELKFDPPAPGADPAPLVSLVRGAVRVIGSELMDPKRPSTVTLQSGLATLKLKGADLESRVVTEKTPDTTDPGSYNRLLIGSGSIGKGTLVEPLTTRQVSFVGPATTTPVTLTSAAPGLFTGSRTALPLVAPTVNGDTKTATTPPPPTAPLVTTTLVTRTPLVVVPPPPIAPPAVVQPIITAPPPRLPVVSCRILRTC